MLKLGLFPNSRLKSIVPKTYALPHFEHFSPILLGISKTLKKKMEPANDHGLRTLLNTGCTGCYYELLSPASVRSLEHRRCVMSLSLVYKSIDGLAPLYISSFLKPRITHYNLRGNGHNVPVESFLFSLLFFQFLDPAL